MVMLISSTSSLKKMVVEELNRKDVLSFYKNILMAHRTNKFGGKHTLWDFLKDVEQNLNRAKQGFGWSTNNKAFAETMKVYGGRRMSYLFQLNFVGPNYKTIKNSNKNSICFIHGEHCALFRCVARI